MFPPLLPFSSTAKNPLDPRHRTPRLLKPALAIPRTSSLHTERSRRRTTRRQALERILPRRRQVQRLKPRHALEPPTRGPRLLRRAEGEASRSPKDNRGLRARRRRATPESRQGRDEQRDRQPGCAPYPSYPRRSLAGRCSAVSSELLARVPLLLTSSSCSWGGVVCKLDGAFWRLHSISNRQMDGWTVFRSRGLYPSLDTALDQSRPNHDGEQC